MTAQTLSMLPVVVTSLAQMVADVPPDLSQAGGRDHPESMRHLPQLACAPDPALDITYGQWFIKMPDYFRKHT